MNECVESLNKQIGKIESLKFRPAYNPKYKIWRESTTEILRKCFNQKYVDMFRESGPKTIATNPEHRYKLFLENLAEKEALLTGFIEEKMEFKNGNIISVSRITSLDDYDFHPVVKNISDKLFKDGHYSQAVEEAFKRVIKEVRLCPKGLFRCDIVHIIVILGTFINLLKNLHPFVRFGWP